MKTQSEVVKEVKAAAIEIMADLAEEIGWLDHSDASGLVENALEQMEVRLGELTAAGCGSSLRPHPLRPGKGPGFCQ